jgi:hypothetical protein
MFQNPSYIMYPVQNWMSAMAVSCHQRGAASSRSDGLYWYDKKLATNPGTKQRE